MEKFLQFKVLLTAIIAAALLASHQVSQFAPFGVLGSYLYWLCRVLIEAGFFFALLFAIEHSLRLRIPRWACFTAAIFLSLIPFTLAITTFDLILGLPELGLNSAGAEIANQSRLKAFGLELIYLSDNHIAVCLLLLLPRIMISDTSLDAISETAADEHATSTIQPPTVDESELVVFLESLEPALQGSLCAIEAQEHYIKVTTTAESRMVLHRFSDAVQQLPASQGMQVHRSHWVAHAAVTRVAVDGQNMKLELNCDRSVPVSRTFRAAVEQRYSESLSHQT